MTTIRRAAIIAVGSELLTPSRVDTNSLFITEVLNNVGIDVVSKAIVGDDHEELRQHFTHALARVDVLVLTGGLGPTEDDVTRDVVAAALGRSMHEDAAIVDSIRRRFESRGWKMPEINRRQGMVPEGAIVLANPNGTAPGLWIEHEGKAVALLPGPPREMRPMLERLIAERIGLRTAGTRVVRRVAKIAGRSESRVEELTQPVYSTWREQQPPIETTILAAPGQIELHFSTRGTDVEALNSALDRAIEQVREVLHIDIFSVDGRSLEAVVGDLLRERGWRIAIAESCTGGLATSRLTDVSGSSAYVERGIVAYSNETKVELLDVDAALLEAHGAVSEPVAEAMAQGIRRRAGVEIGVGITGIAGPTGGTEQKPVGTVCIAASGPGFGATTGGGDTWVRTFKFLGGREMVKTFASFTAIDVVRRLLLQSPAETDWLRK